MHGVILKEGVTDFAFMEKVEQDTMNATDFFDMLGALFTNDTLGHFEEEVCLASDTDLHSGL